MFAPPAYGATANGMELRVYLVLLITIVTMRTTSGNAPPTAVGTETMVVVIMLVPSIPPQIIATGLATAIGKTGSANVLVQTFLLRGIAF